MIADTYSDTARKVCLIHLLNACDANGEPWITFETFENLVHFLNGLAPVYDTPALATFAGKSRQGPRYSQLDWDLKRLTTMRLIDISGFKTTDAQFRVSGDGLAFLAASHRVLERDLQGAVERFSLLCSELVAAYLTVESSDPVMRDAAYADRTVPFGGLVNFTQVNRTIDFVTLLRSSSHFNLHQRDLVYLYLRFLGAENTTDTVPAQ